MRNWIGVVKKVREVIIKYPDSTLCQAKYVTELIRENFSPKKKSKIFKES
jgi:ubiquinone biosynthesis protein Coq4